MSADKRLSRRQAIGAGALPFASLGVGTALQQDPNPQHPLIVRQNSPANLETPFGELKEFITPTERFYVRSHFPTPKVTSAGWKLTIEGAVRQSRSFTYDELMDLAKTTIASTMECAGNGRVFLQPAVPGVQWAHGAVSTAEWTGVPVRTLLQMAGLKREALEAIFYGADKGIPGNPPKPATAIPFARSLPLPIANRGETLIALKMNGQPLTAAHGFPCRVVVAGHYGMASIKWLDRIVVTETPFNGYFQTVDYSQWVMENGSQVIKPLGDMQVKSAIAWPNPFEVVKAGSRVEVRGAAWTGKGQIDKVEVSADGGATWNPAKLAGEKRAHCWRFWTFPWQIPAAAGETTLMARATDSTGATQPKERDADRNTYLISHVLPVPVSIR